MRDPMRKLTSLDKVKYTVECLHEDVPIDDMYDVDDEYTKWIVNQLNDGNEWAWCCIKVTAEWNGHNGVDYLGCCSYMSMFDFMKSEYYNSMKDQALQDLNNTLENIVNKSNEIKEMLEKELD